MNCKVYKLTISNKVYVGYTSKTTIERLQQHIKNAQEGKDTYLCRAIRRYGADTIEMVTLLENLTKREAVQEEMRLIAEHKSNVASHGYNMTLGGDGGDTFSGLSEKRKQEVRKTQSARSTKSGNGRWSGYSDERIIQEGMTFFIDNQSLGRIEWRKYCKKTGLPQSFSKNRFNGSHQVFVSKVKELLKQSNVPFDDCQFSNLHNTYSQESRNKISKTLSAKKRKWYNDGVKSYILPKNHQDIHNKKLKEGRINAANKDVKKNGRCV